MPMLRIGLMCALIVSAGCAGVMRSESAPTPRPTPPLFLHKDTGVDFLNETKSNIIIAKHFGDERIQLTYSNPQGMEVGQSTEVAIAVRGRTVFARSYDGLSPLWINLVGIQGLPRPLIDVGFYSGGAHCCASALYIEPALDAADTYSTYREWGDYPPQWERLGADRHYALVATAGTEYEFGSFGGSTGPIVVYEYLNHSLQDTSMQHPIMLAHDARTHLAEYNLEAKKKSGFNPSGAAALVSYLADEYRLGHAQDAWRRVDQLYQGDIANETADQFAAHAKQWLRTNGLDKVPAPTTTASTKVGG